MAATKTCYITSPEISVLLLAAGCIEVVMAALWSDKAKQFYLEEIEKARQDLRALIYCKNCAPIMLRLAWHDAGTYDAKTRNGGPDGSIRNEEELKHNANNGLKIAVDLCEEAKTKHPTITYADLYQLAGVVAVEVTGGPPIDFIPGLKAIATRRPSSRCQTRCITFKGYISSHGTIRSGYCSSIRRSHIGKGT